MAKISRRGLPTKKWLKRIERLLKTPSAEVSETPMLFVELRTDFGYAQRYALGRTEIVIRGDAPRVRRKAKRRRVRRKK